MAVWPDASWTNFAGGVIAKIETTITTWATGNVNNGLYTIRLRVRDKAGNITDFPVGLTLGNFRAFENTNVHQLNSAASGTVTFRSIVPFTLTETVVLQNSQGAVVRTLVNNAVRNAGNHYDVWDGRGENGVMLPDGTYYFVATVSESGYTMVWDRRNFMISGGTSCGMIESILYDPFNNLPLTWSVNLNVPGRVQVYFINCAVYPTGSWCQNPGCSSQVLYVNELRQSGTFTVKWPAIDSFDVYRSNLYWGKYNIEYNKIPESVTILYGTKPVISNLALVPPLYAPGLGNQSINFTLATYQNQPATVTVTYYNQDSMSVLRTLTFPSVSPGSVALEWDGLADNGMRVAEGTYTVKVSVTDDIGNETFQKILTVVKY